MLQVLLEQGPALDEGKPPGDPRRSVEACCSAAVGALGAHAGERESYHSGGDRTELDRRVPTVGTPQPDVVVVRARGSGLLRTDMLQISASFRRAVTC